MGFVVVPCEKNRRRALFDKRHKTERGKEEGKMEQDKRGLTLSKKKNRKKKERERCAMHFFRIKWKREVARLFALLRVITQTRENAILLSLKWRTPEEEED